MPREPLWTGLPPILGEVSTTLQDTFQASLSDYLSFRQRTRPLGPKIINDPVWHTIRLDSWEVFLLDSPILQRLRGIRQLGLAWLVFPGAGYSRFEHSLGALHQVQRLAEAINRNAGIVAERRGLPPRSPISEKDSVLLRLAALVHDIGHCFFSHVSERQIHHLARIGQAGGAEEMRAEAKIYFGCEKLPPAAEILSSLIILISVFVKLLHAASPPYWSHNASQLAGEIAHLVVGGKKPFAYKPMLSAMISGLIDADKLDYMPRDCYAAGLPMPVDVERLLEKVACVRQPVRLLPFPEDYARDLGLELDSAVDVLAVGMGGTQAFEEMVLSRAFLYQKLYYHQKIRSLEGMLENAIELLRTSCASFERLEDFIGLSDQLFLACKWPNREAVDRDRYEAAKRLIEDIALRRAFIRAFAFGPEMIALPKADKDKRRAWRGLRPALERERRVEAADFRRELVGRAQEYLRLVGQAGLAKDLSEHHVVVDLPDVQGIAEKTKQLVGDESFGLQLYSDLFQVSRWSEAFENQKHIGYVFCPQEFAVAIHLAFRDLVKDKHGIDFEERSLRLTKLDYRDLVVFRELLVKAGKEIPKINVRHEVEKRRLYEETAASKRDLISEYRPVIRDLGGLFSTYESDGGERVDENRIVDWLLQFQSFEIHLAVKVLQHVSYWSRSALVDVFRTASEDLPPTQGAQCLALGAATASGPHLAYLWQDVQRSLKIPIRILAKPEEIAEGETLILYDDNVGSGKQAIAALQQWCGLPKDEWLVEEVHASALSAELLARLSKCQIHFLFATGLTRGLDALVKAARGLLKNDHVFGRIVVPTDLSCLSSGSRVFKSSEEIRRAEEALRNAGLMALAHRLPETDWGKAKVEQRCLGYGNAGGLTVFYYNVPTTTVTALWQNSPSNNPPWMALFPRRPR